MPETSFPTPNLADPTAGYTARRTDKGSKPFVTVYGPDGQPVATLGGNRAFRATAVLIHAYGPDHGTKADGTLGYGDWRNKTQVQGLRQAAPADRRVEKRMNSYLMQYIAFSVPVDTSTASAKAKLDTSYSKYRNA